MLQSFHTMFGRLQEIWKSIRPRHLWLGVFALVLVGTFLLVEPTYAQEGVATSVGDWLLRQVAKIMLVVASLSIGLAIFFLRFFIMIASYNNYIDVSVVQLGWVMVRDVANMFFVVALLLIAFGTILGLEEYEWKKNLAKLILSAILINFSNLIAQLCIDIAHIFTITFLNAISATAGGNLVNMFKLDEILKLTAVEDPSGLDVELLAAVLPAMLFAIMAAAAIGSYVIVMMARVVALWALIVISPLAFILGVIPQTKSYADKWWAEFSKYVIVAPIMVFFLWLAFATLGLGGIAAEIERDLPTNVQISPAEQQFGGQRLSMSQVTSWENMANFLVAFAFLMYGIKATQETGVVGSGMIGSAVDFGKKVATIASGYAAGRWLVGKTAGLAKDGALGAGNAVFGGYVEQVKNFAKRQTVGAYQNWKTAGPQKAEDDKQKLVEEKLLDENRQLTASEIKAGYSIEDRGKEGKFLVQGLSEMDVAKGYKIIEEENEKGENVRSKLLFDKYKLNIKTDEQGNVLYKKDSNGKFLEDENGNRIAEGSDKPIYESFLQGFANKSHAALLTSRKKLEKVENDTKLNEEMMDKTIDAQPSHWLSTSNKSQQKDYDRFKRGMLAAMEKRSSAKSEEFASRGEKMVMDSKRFKDGKFQTERGTIAEQVASHEGKAAASRSELDQVVRVAKERFLGTGAGKKAFEGKIKADLEVKARDASISKIEAGITTDVALAAIEGTKAENAKMDKYRQELEGAQSGPPDQFYAKQEEILKKMMGEGLVSKDEYEDISKNQRINRAMQTHSGMDKEAALGELVKEGVISENEKKKVAEKMGAGREMSYTFPKEKENVLQRTIAQEKAAHLEAEKLATIQKEEEKTFAKGDHGVHEAEAMAVLKERTAAAEAEISEEQTAAERKYRDVFMSKYMNQITAAREKLVSKEPAERAEGQIQYDEIWEKIEADQNPLARKLAAEKRAHTDTNKTQRLDKVLEEVYAGSKEGSHELGLDVQIASQKALSEQEIKRREAVAKKSFLSSEPGESLSETTKKSDLLTQVEDAEIKHLDALAVRKAGQVLQEAFSKINIAEQGVAAAQEFIKTLKTDKLREAFTGAAQDMAKIIKEGSTDREKMLADLEKAAQKNKFIDVLASSVKQKEATDSLRYQQTLATESASAGFYEIPRFGRATPSQAVDPMVAEASKALKSMEAADGGSLAARQLGSILRQKRENKDGGITDQQRASLFATVSHITTEAWTDDTLAEIAALFKDLDDGKINKDSDDGKDIAELKNVFMEDLKLMEKKSDGEYVSYSNPENAAALQSLVVMGGDIKFAKAHNKISAVKDSLAELKTAMVRNEDEEKGKDGEKDFQDRKVEVLNKAQKHMEKNGLSTDEAKKFIQEFGEEGEHQNVARSYEDLAKQMANTGMLATDSGINSFEEFDKELESKQDIIQEASSVFKRGALNAKHIQNGAHQAYDARWRGEGRYRLMTPGEAVGLMTSEGVKRSGLESSQYHSVGTVDNSRGRLTEISEKMFALIFGQMRDSVKAGAVLPRTLDQVMGYASGGKKKTGKVGEIDGLFKIGGSINDMADLVGVNKDDVKQVRQAFFDKMLAPMLRGDAQALQLLISKKSGVNNNLDANAGVINSMIDLGGGESIGGKKFSDLLRGFKKVSGANGLIKIDKRTLAHIEKMIKVYELKEKEIGAGRGRSAGEDAAAGDGGAD